jgi:hypothetical protein
MSLKNIKLKSAIAAITLFTLTNTANAKVQYNAGLGWGIGLFKFNDSREDSTFQGDVAVGGAGMSLVKPGENGNVAMRTTYKYVGNQPPRILSFDFGINNSREDIRVGDRNFFYGLTTGFGWGKTYNSAGLTNPNGKYMNTGSTALYFALNSRFGVENPYSKFFGIFGLTYAKTDLPFDILPFGTGTSLGDLATCTVMKPGSTLLESVGNATLNAGTGPVPIPVIAGLINGACNNIKVNDASYGTYFLNFGASAETKITETLNFFVEYTYLAQLWKNKSHSVDYTVNGNKGTFKGKIRTNDTQFIRAGVRYYF